MRTALTKCSGLTETELLSRTTNLSADSVSEGNGESEDDEGKSESNQDFHSETGVSVYGA